MVKTKNIHARDSHICILNLQKAYSVLHILGDQSCSDLSEVLIWISVEQTALSCRNLSLKDNALTGANQDGPCVGLIAQQFVPAYALDEVASPAGQTARLLCVPVEVQTLAGAQADEQVRACNGKITEEYTAPVVNE